VTNALRSAPGETFFDSNQASKRIAGPRVINRYKSEGGYFVVFSATGKAPGLRVFTPPE
jgi:hypothetical protein